MQFDAKFQPINTEEEFLKIIPVDAGEELDPSISSENRTWMPLSLLRLIRRTPTAASLKIGLVLLFIFNFSLASLTSSNKAASVPSDTSRLASSVYFSAHQGLTILELTPAL